MTGIQRAALLAFAAAAVAFAAMLAVASAQAISYASPVTATWDPNPPEQLVAGYRLVVDSAIHDAGAALSLTLPLEPGPHTAALLAYTAAGLASPPSAAVDFVVAAQAPPACAGHPMTIVVDTYTETVKVGARGRILFDVLNPFPVVLAQVRIGAQVVAQFKGEDLRDAAGARFSMPRTPGPYPIAVVATDSAGCGGQTSLLRIVTVVP